MRREDYYRPHDHRSREDYQRRNYQQPQSNQGPTYNNYGGPQQPYYPPRRRHHVFLWIVVIILCLGLGWFAADHFMGNDDQSSTPQTTVNRSNTTNNKTTNNTTKPQTAPQQPNVGKLESEMNKLDVSENNQAQAIKFYEGQSQKNQAKMNKMIDMVNKVVPSNTMKKQALNWILH